MVIVFIASSTGCMSLFPKEDEMLSIPAPSFALVEYRTITPKRGDIVNSIDVLGIVTADYEEATKQFFNVNGYINEVYISNEQYE